MFYTFIYLSNSAGIVVQAQKGIHSVKSTCQSEHQNKTMRFPLARDVQKVDFVGAYRHPGEISGDISAYGINLKQLAAVLVCKMFTTIHCACWNWVVSVSPYWTIYNCGGKIQYKNCIKQHKTCMNMNWGTGNICASIKTQFKINISSFFTRYQLLKNQ